jgi:hypothetical protein
MFQNGNLLCDGCLQQILLDAKLCTQLLVEFVKGGGDRHYCENCFVIAQHRSGRSFETTRPDIENFN